VFGDLIHTYDIRQSQEDKATVPIFYEPRQVRLHLSAADIDASLKDITDGLEEAEESDLERRKSRWAALAAAAGAKGRVEQLAAVLLAHFIDRTATLDGKAMAVCMTRANAVRLYDELKKLPGCPEIKVVMTGDLGKDPKAWSEAGHLTTKPLRDAIKKRMVDPDDPLKLVIVVDMWLTGTDIPCLHTLYIDKPMRGHTIIQAISRVNRVFRDKPHGLVVDYIGIGDELREATNTYTRDGGRGEPAPDIGDAARPVFLKTLDEISALLPAGHDYGAWSRSASGSAIGAGCFGTRRCGLQSPLRGVSLQRANNCRLHSDPNLAGQLGNTSTQLRQSFLPSGSLWPFASCPGERCQKAWFLRALPTIPVSRGARSKRGSPEANALSRAASATSLSIVGLRPVSLEAPPPSDATWHSSAGLAVAKAAF